MAGLSSACSGSRFNILATTAPWRERDPTALGAARLLVSPLSLWLLLKALSLAAEGWTCTVLRDKTKPLAAARAQTKAAQPPSAQFPTGTGLTGTGAHQQALKTRPAQQRPQRGAPEQAAHGAGWRGTARSAQGAVGGATHRPALPATTLRGPLGPLHPVPWSW